MSVGVPALDADHRCMVKIVNLLHSIKDDEGSRETIETVLDTLKLYGRMHFKREETVMKAIGFPGAAFHSAEHQGFARYIETLRNSTKKGADSKLAATLFDYLTGWLRHHILIQDMAFKPYIRNYDAADELARSAAPGLPNVVEMSAEV